MPRYCAAGASESTLRSPKPLPKTRAGSVAFDGVSFAYPSGPDRPTLDDVSFATRPGEPVLVTRG